MRGEREEELGPSFNRVGIFNFDLIVGSLSSLRSLPFRSFDVAVWTS